ncbi:MAG TPA: FHA domain-containing protein, partial [Planctomycetota bacterium]|nr:FHA domain-containing protein [Planctomycetota bacterium]
MQEQEFVLVGSQGTFTVPPGESRIGSDAACQICIRGDGVLPVHAYLRMDAGKLLIRPADPTGSSDKTPAGRVVINGKPVTGPMNVSGGQEVAIGNVQMRVMVSGKKAPPLWSRRWVRNTVYSFAATALVLLLAYLYIAFVVLDEAALKRRISEVVKKHLLRDDTEITSVQVRLFDGTIQITDVRIKDRYNVSSSARPFIRIPAIRVKLDMWPLLISGMREYSNLDIAIDRPEINIERSKGDGAFSIEDILDKYRRGSGRTDLDLDKLDFRLAVSGGSVYLRDNYSGIGETSAENIEVVIRGTDSGAPLQIERCEMTTPSSSKLVAPGALKVSGSVHLFDQAYGIETSRISSDDLRVEMQNFDLARVFEHFGYAWQPYRANFKVVLGKPLTGSVNVKLRGLTDIRTEGSVSSESLISLREEAQTPLGNIPMVLDWDTRLLDDGKGYAPHDLSLDLKGGPSADPYVSFKALGKLNPGGTSNYTLNFECRMQDLLSTDVGKRLGLEGSMGGRLKGTGTLLRQPSGALKIDARMESLDGYVNVSDPGERTKPPELRKPPVRQPLPLKFDCHANADPSPSGTISHLNIESFTLSAHSFSANSEVPGVIKGLGPDEKLEAHAQFILKLKGREFWSEFAPILALFGFTRPVEEIFDLKVTVATDSQREGVVSVAADGTAARQWGPDSAPVQLLALLEYDVNAAARKGGTPPPYLTLGLKVVSEKELPLLVRLRAVCSRTDAAETIVFEGFEPETSMLINSDVNTLRERFAPYIESWLRAHDEARGLADKGWLTFYRDTQLKGALEQSGRVVIERMRDPKAAQPDRLTFDMNIAAKDFSLNVPIENAKGRAGQTDGRFAWTEPNPKLRIKGEYLQRLSTNKEEPHRERLTIHAMDVDGRLGGFQLALQDLDLFRLANIAALPNQAWTDVLESLTISGQIHPPACDFLRGVGVLLPRDPVSGHVALQIAFDRKKDALSLEKLIFKQDEQQRDFPLAALDVNGSLLRLRDLSNRLFPVKDAVPFSERLAAFIHEGGPAAMLDHLGDDLSVNHLQIETGPLMDWLKREQKAGDEGRVVPPLIASLRKGDWQPEGTWKIAGLKLSRVGDPRKRAWKLVGAMLRNDLSIFGPTPAGEKERPTLFRFTHDWKLQLGLSLSEDNSVGLVGDIHLDDAYIAASVPHIGYEYRKPAKEPCRIEINEFAYAHGLLAQVGRLRLTGKPLGLDIRDFKADSTGPAKGTYSIGEMVVNGGPFPCVIMLNKYEPGTDALNIRVSAPELDLAWLAKIAKLPPLLQGRVKDLSASYKGSVIALQASGQTEKAALAARYKLNAEDARLNGLNPESDALNVDGKLEDVSLTLPLSAEQTIAAKLAGQ